MIWLMALNPIVVVVAAALGMALCRAAGANPHVHEMTLAAIVCMIGAEWGMIPALIAQRRGATAITQAALAGSVIHLLVTAVAAVFVIVIFRPTNAFVWWVLPLYWVTLFGLCSVFVVRLRRVSS